jgi:hypothetical protein
MNPWEVLADVVMYLHILLPLLFIGVIVFSLFKELSFKWQFFFYVLLGSWIIMEVAPKFGWTKNCPLTDLEYLLRRRYDPSESWVRTKSLAATIVFNITGIELPEWVFTVIFVVIIATAISMVIARKIMHKKSSKSRSSN